jgi:hypothetical protein
MNHEPQFPVPPNQPPPTPQRPEFTDQARRARHAATWLSIAGVVLSIQLVEYLYLASSYGVAEDLTPASVDAGIEAIDILLAVVLFLVLIGTVITFLRWFSAAHANLRALGFTPRYSNGQAIWTWFVPILNLWRPKQIANDIWRSGDVDAPAPSTTIATLPTPGWLLAWWLLLLIPAGSYAEDSILSWLVFAGTLAPSAFLCARFVREATARQRERDARLTRDGFPSGGNAPMPNPQSSVASPTPQAPSSPAPPSSGPFL